MSSKPQGCYDCYNIAAAAAVAEATQQHMVPFSKALGRGRHSRFSSCQAVTAKQQQQQQQQHWHVAAAATAAEQCLCSV
jgi:hypothetical protein